MQNHYEDTEFENNPLSNNGSPHHSCGFGVEDSLTVCNIYNDYRCITQLRSWMPSELGNIMWISPRYPCIQPFIPWYYGIKKISTNYEKAVYKDALANYNNKNRNYIEMYPDHACWVFDEFANKIDSCYREEIKSLGKWKNDFQKDIFQTVAEKETAIIDTYSSDREKALQMLTDLTNGFADRALIETKEKLFKLKNTGRLESINE